MIVSLGLLTVYSVQVGDETSTICVVWRVVQAIHHAGKVEGSVIFCSKHIIYAAGTPGCYCRTLAGVAICKLLDWLRHSLNWLLLGPIPLL